jgi:general secretion pathway protein A
MSAILDALHRAQEKRQASSRTPHGLPHFSVRQAYLADLGLQEEAFNDSPDPRFLYENPVYQEAYVGLLYGIRVRKGFISLIGEAGTGKTTILRKVIGDLDPTIHTAFFNSTTLTFDELLDCLCADFDLPVPGDRRLDKIRALNKFLVARFEEGGTGVLIIDEAHNLTGEVLENLRLLSNLERAGQKLFQIVLVGQPELERKLGRRELRQLRQRIAVRCWLGRLTAQDVEPFIYHRLRIAGCKRPDLFTPEAIRRVAAYAHGIPRLVNTICDNALLLASRTAHPIVSATIIEEVARDLLLKRGGHGGLGAIALALQTLVQRRPMQLAWAGVGALLVAVVVGGSLARFLRQTPQPSTDRPLRVAHVVPERKEARRQSEEVPSSAESASPPSVKLSPAGSGEETAGAALSAQTPSLQAVEGNETAGAETLWAATAPASPPSVTPSAGAPGEEIPQSAPSTQDTALQEEEGLSMTISRGDTISGLVSKMYGNSNLLAFDLIKEFNPHIGDLDRIAVGEQLWLPPHTRKTFVREQSDGSYRVVMASFYSALRAQEFGRLLRGKNYTTVTTPRRVSGQLLLHRVEIVGLRTLEAVNQAWELVGVLDTRG